MQWTSGNRSSRWYRQRFRHIFRLRMCSRYYQFFFVFYFDCRLAHFQHNSIEFWFIGLVTECALVNYYSTLVLSSGAVGDALSDTTTYPYLIRTIIPKKYYSKNQYKQYFKYCIPLLCKRIYWNYLSLKALQIVNFFKYFGWNIAQFIVGTGIHANSIQSSTTTQFNTLGWTLRTAFYNSNDSATAQLDEQFADVLNYPYRCTLNSILHCWLNCQIYKL